MVKIDDIMEHKTALVFVGGMAAALIGKKVIQSKTAKDLCSKGVAKVLMAKSEAEESLQDIKSNAEDIHAAATEANKKEIYIDDCCKE